MANFDNARKWLALFGLGKKKSQPVSTPSPTPTATPEPDYEGNIREGMTKWGKGNAPPIATMSAELAEVGKTLPHKYLPAALSLKETGGLSGSEKARQLNNPFGIGKDIQYPDLRTAILGGVTRIPLAPRLGLKGVLANKKYDKYRQTGNLEDFLQVYTPPGPEHGNPDMQRQLWELNNLLSNFPSQ